MIDFPPEDYPFDFVIAALPRCGTAWASNFLTYGDVFCYHEATRLQTIPTPTFRIVGNADPFYGIRPDMIPENARVLVVTRDPEELAASYAALGDKFNPGAKHAFEWTKQLCSYEFPRNEKVMWVDFEELFTAPLATAAWMFLTGEDPQPIARVHGLARLNVQSDMRYTASEYDKMKKLYSQPERCQ